MTKWKKKKDYQNLIGYSTRHHSEKTAQAESLSKLHESVNADSSSTIDMQDCLYLQTFDLQG